MSATGIKQNQNDIGYYIPIGDLRNKVYGLTAGPTFSTAYWANSSITSTYIASAGAGILKDLGKTVVSSTRTFRKVQLVLPNSPSTFGVGGASATPAGVDYLTGYIELGFDGIGSPAPVAHFGR